jgi:thiol-disulfide isomerase/thioredoxin
MQRILLAVLVIWIAALAVACSTTNSSTTGIPNWDDRDLSFNVSTDTGAGTFKPVLDVQETAEGATVTITAENAQELSSAFLHLSYNPGRYTPDRVEVGTFLGEDDQVISLAVTDVAGDVPVGLVQVPASGITPASGSGVLATVYFSAQPFTAARQVSAEAPTGSANAVDDLTIVSQDSSTASLRWTEKNVGDYDNNSEVNIADLSPLALFFGQTVSSTADPEHARMVDGDRNGEITLADITPIGQNFGNSINGYIVYTDGGNSATVGTGITVLRSAQTVVNNRPVVYNFDAPIDGSPQFVVKPAVQGQESNPGVPSNTAIVINEPGDPQAPGNLTAEGGEAIGSLKIELNWDLSTSIDVEGYEIERKLSTEPDASFAMINEVGPALNTYTDQTDLTDASYDYRVRARDLTGLFSPYTSTATATPWVFVVTPPTNLAAVPSTEGGGIDVTWDSPAGATYPLIYKLYMKGEADSEFAVIKTKLVTNAGNDDSDARSHTAVDLNEGEDYQFYATVSVGGNESAPTATVTAQPSVSTDLELISISTDKTTHYTGGGEGVSTITIVTDPVATSYDWSSTVGSVTGTGASVTWEPTGNPAAQVVTISCTASKGSASTDAEIKLYLTSETIKTTYQMGGGDGGDIGENGRFVDFSRPSTEAMTAPYKSMSDYMTQDHVVLYNLWEIWCGPCRGEMDEMHAWAVNYKDQGYLHVGHSATWSMDETKKWLNDESGQPEGYLPPNDTRPWNEFICFNVDETGNGTGDPWGGDPVWTDYWSGYGPQGKSLPRTLLFDRDGYCRKWSSTIGGALVTEYEELIEELCGP